ncbi:hypothetical protein BC628DRAFT_1342557 [Trametes gibbosa]|nr:hypothetical protein BC628DRAFT_1342557 [Trametes gibbosa]
MTLPVMNSTDSAIEAYEEFIAIESNTCSISEFLTNLGYVLDSLQYAIWAGFSCLRVYALRRQWAWALGVLVLALVPVPIDLTRIWITGLVFDPVLGCLAEVKYSPHTGMSLDLGSRLALITADIATAGINWAATRDFRSTDMLRAFGRATTLSRVLYQTGTAYFIVMTIMNVLYLLAWILPVILPPSSSAAYAVFGTLLNLFLVMYESLTAALVAEFLLRLHEAAHGRGAGAGGTSTLGSIDMGCDMVGGGQPDAAGVRSNERSLLEFARADVDQWIRGRRSESFVGEDLGRVGEDDGDLVLQDGEGEDGHCEARESVHGGWAVERQAVGSNICA